MSEEDRYDRAAKVLEKGLTHFDASLEKMRAIVDDFRALAAEALEKKEYPSERLIPDALAFSLNAIDAVSCPPADASPTAQTLTFDDEPVVDGRKSSDDDDRPLDRGFTKRLTIVFDIMSEMAGPIGVDVALGTPTTIVPTSLTPVSTNAATATAIPAARVKARILDGMLVVTLVGLKGVISGTYTGSITLSGFDAGETTRTFGLTAECRDELFWIDSDA